MPMIFNNEIITQVAIDAISDNLLALEAQTNGAISVGATIHQGNFVNKTLFEAIGAVERRDPTVDVANTANRLGNLEQNLVKTYFKDLLFATYTELAKYGTSMEEMNIGIGEALAEAVVRFGANKCILATSTAIQSNANLTHTGGATLTHADLVEGIFKFGDMAQKIRTLVAPSAVVGNLIGTDTVVSGDRISYGAVYDGMTGTVGRSLWQVDAEALMIGGKSTVLGLVEGAVTLDASELIRFFSQEVIDQENAGVNFRSEGAYTVDVKGFSYDPLAGANPTDAILGDTANWSMFVSDRKNTAGVAILSA